MSNSSIVRHALEWALSLETETKVFLTGFALSVVALLSGLITGPSAFGDYAIAAGLSILVSLGLARWWTKG